MTIIQGDNHLMRLIRSIIKWVQDDWSGKLMFLLFVGPLIYLPLRYFSLAAILYIIVVGYICYGWGLINGSKKSSEKDNDDF